MNNAWWQIVGILGIVGYAAAVVLIFVGWRLLGSKNEKHARLGLFLVSALGGPSSARAASAEVDRRWMAH
jgi:hypothetical protein